METGKIDLLRRAMQAYTWRLQAGAGNVANLETPGYQRSSVAFEDELRVALQSPMSQRKGLEINPEIRIDERPPQLEEELMELADTQMRTQLATRALRDHFELIRTGITGRTA
jgi:flagellar basal-body rod protein FlgB